VNTKFLYNELLPTPRTLTVWSREHFEKLTEHSVNKLTAFHGTRIFITVIKNAHHRSLPGARSVKSTLYQPMSSRTFLILLSRLRLGFSSYIFSPGFPNTILHLFIISSMYATCQVM